MRRKALSKKIRFEVFKRDSFACQYCGKKAPEVVLHVDHINPVSKGGANELLNLLTSCSDCNLGKGARTLADDSVLARQRKQLEELEERRAQLTMMLDWQRSLVSLNDDAVSQLEQLWREITPGFGLNQTGRALLKEWIQQLSVLEISTAMREAAAYLKHGDAGELTYESVGQAFGLVPKIAHVNRQTRHTPNLKSAMYIRGILRRRFSYLNEEEAKRLLLLALDLGSSFEHEKSRACTERNWTQWSASILDTIDALREDVS